MSVFEVARPDRRLRRQAGKSDPIDAEAAARAVLAGKATRPKAADGRIEAMRALRVARNGAVKARTAAVNTLRSLIVAAPEPLRDRLTGSGSQGAVVATCARLRPDLTRLDDPSEATKLALRRVALRAQALGAECRELDQRLRDLVATAAPETLRLFALGPTQLRPCSSASVTTLIACARRLPSPGSAASLPSRPPRGTRDAIGCTAAATGRPTVPCTSRWWYACATAHGHVPTSPVEPPRVSPSPRSSAA